MRWREDQLEERGCPNCGGELTEPRHFNQMLTTNLGPVQDDSSLTFLRPETAQGIFVNFNNVVTATRRRPPFGIAQIGKAFRNEITTGNFIFRTREFEMMEIEFFVEPGQDEEWHETWVRECVSWYSTLGIHENRLRLRPHDPDELSHYSKATTDVEYRFPLGLGGDPGHRQPHRLRPARPLGPQRRGPGLLRRRHPRARHPIRDRTVRRRGPRRHVFLGGRLHRGGDRRR